MTFLEDLIDTHRKKNSGEGSFEEEISGAEKEEDVAWESSENLKTNQANDEDSKSESKSEWDDASTISQDHLHLEWEYDGITDRDNNHYKVR